MSISFAAQQLIMIFLTVFALEQIWEREGCSLACNETGMQTHVWLKNRELIEALAPRQISIYLHCHKPPDIPGPPIIGT